MSVPEYAVVMTLEAYIFEILALGVHLLSAVDVLVPIWLVLPLGCAAVAIVLVSAAVYALTWQVQTWIQEPSWEWVLRLKLMVFDQNLDLSLTGEAITAGAHTAYIVFVAVWWAVLLHVLAIWIGDEGHVDGLWHALFRRDLAVSTMQVSTMKLNVMVALTLLGVVALMLLPVSTFLQKHIQKKEDEVEQILESRQNSLIYVMVCVSLLIQYTIFLSPLQKMMTFEEKYLLFALLPLFADAILHGVLGRRLTLTVLCESFGYVNAGVLIVLSCAGPATALTFAFLEQNMFIYPQFFLINLVLLTLLLASRALDCHLAITYARKKHAGGVQDKPEHSSTRWGRGTKQPKFFFKRASATSKKNK